MSRDKRIFLLILILISLGLGLLGVGISQNEEGVSSVSPVATFEEVSPSGTLNADGQVVKVVRVVDGDTIEIEGGQKVRYIGIDTPETVDPRRPVACFGKEASDENKKLVEGKQVRLEKDVSETDKYGRLLRYVYVGDIFVNDYLVRHGYAQVSTYPPDVKFTEQFLEAERDARENQRGLWKKCF